MHTILIFLFSSLISFIGSLQLGPVNLFVIDTTINKNKRSAYFVALGGTIPEFIYCALAVYSGSFFLRSETIFFIFKLLLISILLIVAFVYFFKKHKLIGINIQTYETQSNQITFFLKGFSLAILNPQLLPFWMFILVYFNTVKFLTLKSEIDKISYIFGAGLGAFILLVSIILTINKYRDRVLQLINNKYYFKVLAILFFAIAIQQLISLL